jgi:hypothetical protein
MDETAQAGRAASENVERLERRVVADGRFAALWLDTRVRDEWQDACVWLEFSE